MKNTDREEALELPDREAMAVLSTTRVIPVDSYGPLSGDPAGGAGCAQESP